jgi:hypothetical protein
VDLLGQFQAEPRSLYAFDQALLEAMQEGLAVFSSRWNNQAKLGVSNLDEFAALIH